MLFNQYQRQYWEQPTHSFGHQLGRLLLGMGKSIKRFFQLREQQRQLLTMDSHMLKDIGITRTEIQKMTKWRCFR